MTCKWPEVQVSASSDAAINALQRNSRLLYHKNLAANLHNLLSS